MGGVEGGENKGMLCWIWTCHGWKCGVEFKGKGGKVLFHVVVMVRTGKMSDVISD